MQARGFAKLPAMETTDRQTMETDIAVAGFGPAAAGFLATLAPELAKTKEDGTPLLQSSAMPGMPLQVLCYERADDTGFGVSGIVTRAESIRKSFPDLDLAKEIPNSVEVKKEKLAYLFDHLGCSRRTSGTKFMDACFRMGGLFMRRGPSARELPFIPRFMEKRPGLVLNMGAFMGWCAERLMASGTVQIWPGQPVAGPIFEDGRVAGIRLADQGVDKEGNPVEGMFMPGMEVKAALTVVADGPVGAVGRAIEARFGLPPGRVRHDWAVGMKAVVQLPESCTLEPGTVLHTLGFPEPEIFGFFYVGPRRTASMGIFVPSWMDTPVRTSYRYLQHWMMHPYIWRHIEGGTLLSWGAKSLQESGLDGEPFLAGDGYARIGEGSGSTNCLTNSGVDEAWETGTMLAKAVISLAKAGKPFTKENLEEEYVKPRNASALRKNLEKARNARRGFNKSFFRGMIGEGLCGYTGGRLHLNTGSKPPAARIPKLEKAVFHRVRDEKALAAAIDEAKKARRPLHDAVMDAEGWPQIPFDGKLLMSHQDVLLKGGKVQAAAGFADHVRFRDPAVCASCTERTCIEMCSAQALMPPENPQDPPAFDREKCVHCGACIWNCSRSMPDDPEKSNMDFRAGSGGLHSNEN